MDGFDRLEGCLHVPARCERVGSPGISVTPAAVLQVWTAWPGPQLTPHGAASGRLADGSLCRTWCEGGLAGNPGPLQLASPASRASSDNKHCPQRCSQCGTTKTPMWRNNHDGAKTLCNACGVKQQRASNRAKALAAQAGASKPVGSPHATRPSSAEAPGHPLTPEKLTRSISARSSDRGLGLSGKRRSSEHLGSPRSGQPLDSPPSSHAEHKRSCSGWVGLVPPEGSETSSRRRQQGQRGRYKTAASMQGLELHTDPPDAALLSEITAALVVARSPTEGTVTLALMQGRQVLQQTSDSQAPYIGLQQCENFGYAWDCGQGWSVLLRAPQAQDFLSRCPVACA